MKKILLTLTASLMAVGAFAQGKVNFSTFNFAGATNGNTGALVAAGNGFWAQLYYGRPTDSETSLVSVTNAPVHFAVAGYILNSSPYYTDNSIVAGGTLGKFQVRAWEASLGNTWEVARQAWLTGPAGPLLGVSNEGIIATADGGAVPSQTPAPLSGSTGLQTPIRPFTLSPVPEPSVVALGALGLAAVLWRRRK